MDLGRLTASSARHQWGVHRTGRRFLAWGRFADMLTLYLAQPMPHKRSVATIDIRSYAPQLQYGDVVLTEGNSRMATLVQCLTGSKWSHVSMYVGPLEDGLNPRCIVEADIAAGVRAVPLSEFAGQRTRVLRPTTLRDADRRRVVNWVLSRIGASYDLGCAWVLAGQVLRLPLAHRTLQASRNRAQEASSFICTSLLAQAFVQVGCPIAAPQIGMRDVSVDDCRFVTPSDFERAPGFEVLNALRPT